MKVQQVLIQLFNKLPKYTDLFSTNISVQSLSLTLNIVTGLTAQPHNLTVGETVNITGAIIKNPLITLTQVNDIATGVTQVSHDLTEGFNSTVTIEGAAQPEYNGEFPLLTVPNRRTFTFAISGNPASPATGTIFLFEKDRSINPYTGLKVITSIPTPTSFTYLISQPVYSPPTGSIVLSRSLRVGGAMSFDKANEWYSKQETNKYWLFVVLGDRVASKDRYTQDDATATTAIGNRFRQRVLMPFTCYIFAPSRDDTSLDGVNGRAVRDSMEDVFYALSKSLLGTRFPTAFYETIWSKTTFVSHGFYGYNQAYYVHQFSFEGTFDITYPDIIDPDPNVAFRDIELDFQRLTDDYIISTMAINLDDVPL